MKLLVTSDWQLGKGGRLADQRDVVLEIADVAIDEGVDGVLLGGDILEGPTMQPEQLEVVTVFLDRLQGRIPCLGLTGNGRHDLAVRTRNGLEIFNHIDGIEIHATPALVEFAGAAVGLLPWVHPGRLIATLGSDVRRDEVNAIAADLLLDIADKLNQNCPPGIPSVLLGHWHVDAALNAAGGQITDFVSEPVIPYTDLEAQGWDVIALGHNHRTQTIGGRGFHIGSPMPHDFGEASWEHGVWIIDTCGSSSSVPAVSTSPLDHGQSNGSPAGDPGSTPGFRFIPVESRRLIRFDEHLDAHDREGLTLAFTDCDVDEAIVRVVLHGTSSDYRATADVPAIKGALYAAGANAVEVKADIVREQRARVEGVDEHLTELAALDLYLDANSVDGQLAGRMRTRLHDYIEAAA